ncbi:MAG: hypothetical protein AAGF53_00520 [Pseudomonadota bacterium]
MSIFTHLGPRPRLTLVIENQYVTEIWVDRRAPIISIHDYDWGETDRDPARDRDGFPFTKVNWKQPAWALGLSLHSAEAKSDLCILDYACPAKVPFQD